MAGVDPQDRTPPTWALFAAGALPEVGAGLAAWTLAALGRRPGHALERPVVGLDPGSREEARIWLASGPPAAGFPGGADLPPGMAPSPRSAVFFGDLPDAPGSVEPILDAMPAGATVVVDALAGATLAAVERRSLRPVLFGVEGDPAGAPAPVWTGAVYGHQGGVEPLELFVGGTSCGRFFSPLPGASLARLVVGTIAWLAEDQGLAAREAGSGLRSYRGVEDILAPVGRAAGAEVVIHRTDRAAARRVGVEATRVRRPDAHVLAVADDGGGGAGLEGADEILGPTEAVGTDGRPGPSPDDLARRARPGDVVLVTTADASAHADAILGALTRRALAEAPTGS